MVKRALTLLTSILIALHLLMPFNIYADTIDSHIRGRNYTYEPITYTEFQASSTQKYYQNVGVFHITFELDDEYLGYVLPRYTIQYDNYFYGSSSPSWGTLSKTFDRRIFVNGSSFSFDISINWNSLNVNQANLKIDPFFSDSYTITSSDVTKYADIDSLDQIVNILTDLYNSTDQVEGLLNNQLAQLQLIVSNTSLANQYLDTISKIRKYDFPFESFYPNYFMMYQGYEILDINTYYYWTYPLFKIPSNGMIANHYISNGQYFYLITIGYGFNNLNAISSLLDTALTPVSVRTLDLYNMSNTDLRLNLVTFRNDNASGKVPIYNRYTNNVMFIYMGTSDINGVLNISTDFALRFGLNNKLLNDLHLIANGTAQSSSAAQSSDSANSQLQTDSNTLFQQENGFKSDMQNSMQNIDTTFRLDNMGTKFVNSAQWVRTQYENLTNNTPFASLITFSLITGLALILLGKVYK